MCILNIYIKVQKNILKFSDEKCCIVNTDKSQ